MKRTTASPAFTLTEVVIAIGIFAFAILGILVLMTTALDNARLSATDTALAAMTLEVSTELRSQRFDELFARLGSGGDFTAYFQEDGTRVPGAAGAHYACRVTGTMDAPGLYTNTTFFVGTLEFSWPLAAPAERRSRTVIPLKIARYDS